MLHLIIFAYAQVTEFPNPIEASDLPTLIASIADGLVAIGVPLAVVALIYGGFKFVQAGASGDAKALTEAKQIFKWAVVGTAIVVGAAAIAYAVRNFAIQL